jgi:hypothetical protein
LVDESESEAGIIRATQAYPKEFPGKEFPDCLPAEL